MTDVANLAVSCAQPGSGDALRVTKAGVLEVPGAVLVTKGDLGAPTAAAVVPARTGEGSRRLST